MPVLQSIFDHLAMVLGPDPDPHAGDDSRGIAPGDDGDEFWWETTRTPTAGAPPGAPRPSSRPVSQPTLIVSVELSGGVLSAPTTTSAPSPSW